MGCDIHIIVERRNMDDRTWRATDEQGDDARNYARAKQEADRAAVEAGGTP